MSFLKKIWKNKTEASTSDPRLEATELNRLENGIQEAHDNIANLKASDIATSDNSTVQAVLDKLSKACLIPVNGIYLSMSSANPSTLWPGTTWTQVSQGRMLVGAGSYTDKNGEKRTFVAGATATGEYSHKLTVDELPKHSHAWKGFVSRGLTAAGSTKFLVEGNEAVGSTIETGSDITHNNTSPEFTCYMFKRLS